MLVAIEFLLPIFGHDVEVMLYNNISFNLFPLGVIKVQNYRTIANFISCCCGYDHLLITTKLYFMEKVILRAFFPHLICAKIKIQPGDMQASLHSASKVFKKVLKWKKVYHIENSNVFELWHVWGNKSVLTLLVGMFSIQM